MSKESPTPDELRDPNYVADLDLGAQQHEYDHPAAHSDSSGKLVREEANVNPGPGSVTGPDKANKEFTVTGALDPRLVTSGEGSAAYAGDTPESDQKATGETDSTSPERKSRYGDKH